jgi:DNA-binding NtrC family response regulator
MLPQVLLATLVPRVAARVEVALLESGSAVVRADGIDAVWGHLSEQHFDFVVVEPGLLSDQAEAVISDIRDLPDRPEVVLLADTPDPAELATLHASGCLAVVSPELPQAALAEVFSSLLERQVPVGRDPLASSAEEAEPGLGSLASASRGMRELLRVARKVVDSDTALLVLGETGAGKEWLARAVHGDSPRSVGPFVAINCAAIPEALLESELFGHEKGAFTGAVRTRRGFFEAAHGGTLFLDEVAELPFHLQAKLLRALQEGRIQRIGAETDLHVDVRIMAATSQDLEEAMAGGRFRRDLFYRLSVMALTVPPLRERKEDISSLAVLFLRRFRSQLNRPELVGFDRAARRAILAYEWPGNVRELINVIERAVLLTDGRRIGLADLPEAVAGSALTRQEEVEDGLTNQVASEPWLDLPLKPARQALLDNFERRYLARLLERTRGRVGETAARAGVNTRTIYNKMKRYGLRKDDFKD